MSVVLADDGRSIVKKYSSSFTNLLHFYDVDPSASLEGARTIDGTAIVLCDDAPPTQYCHWLVDWLPRLAVLGSYARRSDHYVIVAPMTAPFQFESLRMCGFDRSRIVEIQPGTAVRARELLVTSDIRSVPHPALKAAPWAMAYLRSTMGMAALLARHTSDRDAPKKFFISRADSAGRQLRNEDALLSALGPHGYSRVVLSVLCLTDQIALFAGATHVIGLHGAGLSSVVFMVHRATVIEIFAQTYGTPAFYVLTAGLENIYASYVETNVIPQSRAQLDDIELDVDAFMQKSADLL